MPKIIKFLVTEFLYNGHLQSLGGVGLVYISELVSFGKSPSFIVMLTTYCIFESVFVFDRFVGLMSDSCTNKLRSSHLYLWRNYIPYFITFLLIMAVFLNVAYLGYYSLFFSCLTIFLGFLYPLYFKKLTKKIFIFKNYYVSLVYALFVFYPFVVEKNSGSWSLTFLFSFLVFLESMLSQIILDIKDIKSDKNAGLLTIGAVFGERQTRRLIKILTGVLGFVFLTLSISVYRDLQLILLAGLSIILNTLILSYLEKSNIKAYILSAGKFLIWFCMTVVVKIVL